MGSPPGPLYSPPAWMGFVSWRVPFLHLFLGRLLLLDPAAAWNGPGKPSTGLWTQEYKSPTPLPPDMAGL